MMDVDGRRVTAFNIVNNRTTTNVADKARALFEFMTALGVAGEQAVIAANNQVSGQSSLAHLIDTAAKNYEFVAGADVPAKVLKAARDGVTDKVAPAPNK